MKLDCPVPKGTSIAPYIELRFRKHYRRESGKTIKVRDHDNCCIIVFYLNRKGRLSHKLPKVLCMKICKDFNRYVNIDGEKHHKALSLFEEIWTVSCWRGRTRDKILSLRGQSLAHANKNDMNWPKRVVFIHIIYSVYIHTYNKNKYIRRGRSWMRDKMSGGHGRCWIGKRDYRKYVTASWLCMKSWNKIWNYLLD